MFSIHTNHSLFLFLSAVVAGDVTAADVAVIAAGAAVGPDGTAAAAVAAVGPDALCGTATAWFHVVDYAC